MVRHRTFRMLRTPAARVRGFGRSSLVGLRAEYDTREDYGHPIDTVEHTILSQVEPPFSRVSGSLAHPQPWVGTKRISKQIEQLLPEQPLVSVRKRQELFLRGLEELEAVWGQANPARFRTLRPATRFSVRQRRSISWKNSSS